MKTALAATATAAACAAAWVAYKLVADANARAAQADARAAQAAARASKAEGEVKEERKARLGAETEVARVKEELRCELEGVTPEALALASGQEVAEYLRLCAEYGVTPCSAADRHAPDVMPLQDNAPPAAAAAGSAGHGPSGGGQPAAA